VSEHASQSALFEWASHRESVYPELALMFAIPNGAKLPYSGTGRGRYSPEAMRLKAEGLRPGCPDIMLPVARQGYHGMFIEMKWGKNKPSEKQWQFIHSLREQEYLVIVCWTWEEAAQAIEDYFIKDYMDWKIRGNT
jgi:hypothetical protein